MFWIGGLAYKYHLETEERRILLKTDIEQKARELNSQVHEEIEKLKKENELLKSCPYEKIRDDGKIEYYNLFTNKLVKQIDNDFNLKEYDKDSENLIKEVDFNDRIYKEYNPVNGKLIKEENHNDGLIKEYDKDNGKLIRKFSSDDFLEIKEYNQNTGKKKKYTKLQIRQNGNRTLKIIFFDGNEKNSMIDEYDHKTGKFIKRTYFNPDGTVKEEKNY